MMKAFHHFFYDCCLFSCLLHSSSKVIRLGEVLVLHFPAASSMYSIPAWLACFASMLYDCALISLPSCDDVCYVQFTRTNHDESTVGSLVFSPQWFLQPFSSLILVSNRKNPILKVCLLGHGFLFSVSQQCRLTRIVHGSLWLLSGQNFYNPCPSKFQYGFIYKMIYVLTPMIF